MAYKRELCEKGASGNMSSEGERNTKIAKNEKFRKEFGERLKHFREKYELTQEEIAEILEISPNYYGKVERGENNLTLERLAKLKESKVVDLNYLVAGEKKEISDLVSLFVAMDQDEMIQAFRQIHEYQMELLMKK